MEVRSKQAGTATEQGQLSPATTSMAEQALLSQSASSEGTETESSPRRLNRKQVRDLIRQLPREHRSLYFWGRHRFSSRLLPKPSNFVRFRKQLEKLNG